MRPAYLQPITVTACFVSDIWHMSHAAWNKLQHALHGNGAPRSSARQSTVGHTAGGQSPNYFDPKQISLRPTQNERMMRRPMEGCERMMQRPMEGCERLPASPSMSAVAPGQAGRDKGR